MPEATFNGTTKTIRIDKCGSYEKTLKSCRDKFKTKHISIIVRDGQVLDSDNATLITNNSILRCYTILEFKKMSQQNKYELEKDKDRDVILNNLKYAIIKSFIKKSYFPYRISHKLTHISGLPGVKEILLYPNLSDNDLFPKGTVIVSDNVYPSVGLRLGRGTTVYFVTNIEPKLKKLKSLQCDLFDGYAEIHKIVDYYDDSFKKYNYIVLVRMSKSDESKEIIDETIKRDTSCVKYGCTDRENLNLISEFYKLNFKAKKLRHIACQKILKKLNVEERNKLIDQTENSIYIGDSAEPLNNTKTEKLYYSLTNVVDCRNSKINIVTGSRNTPSYIVEPLTNFLPSGSGRKVDYFDTIELAKLDNGFINSELRNNSLICNPDDKRTIYQKYFKGYKNIEKTMEDLEHFKLARKLLRTEPILSYKM